MEWKGNNPIPDNNNSGIKSRTAITSGGFSSSAPFPLRPGLSSSEVIKCCSPPSLSEPCYSRDDR